MPEDTFRIVVTAAVALAALAFVVQAAILFAIYRTSRKMEQRTTQFIEEIEPVMHRVGPTLDRAGPAIDKIGPIVERIGPMLDKAGPAIERIGPMADKIGVFAERASAVASTTNRMIDENRPRIAQISS